jgi:hypothetical protein
MNERECIELRNAWNAYKSTVSAAEGFVSGYRVANLRNAERRLRDLLWKHRDALVQKVTKPQVGPVRPTALTPDNAKRLVDGANKLDRHCPRCGAHHYHFARAWQLQRSNGECFGPVHVDIDCADCGHTWRGRYRKDEWE